MNLEKAKADLETAKRRLDAARFDGDAPGASYELREAADAAHYAHAEAQRTYKDLEFDHRLKAHNERAAAQAAAADLADAERRASIPNAPWIPGKFGQTLPAKTPEAELAERRERSDAVQNQARAELLERARKNQGRL